MADPFLEIEAFAAEFQGALTEGQTATATRLLEVVSDYIRLRKPDLAGDDPTAMQVTFEVVRDAITYGPYEQLSSFTHQTSKRLESGAFSDAAKTLDELLTDRHKLMLGISRTAAARGSFARCDY